MLLPDHKLAQVDYYEVGSHEGLLTKKYTTSITIHWKQWWKFPTHIVFGTHMEPVYEGDEIVLYNIKNNDDHAQLQEQLDQYFHPTLNN